MVLGERFWEDGIGGWYWEGFTGTVLLRGCPVKVVLGQLFWFRGIVWYWEGNIGSVVRAA